MQIENINSHQELLDSIQDNEAALLYFSTQACNVCKVLKPKVAQLLEDRFPKIRMFYVDTERVPEASGQFSVFAAPTLAVFFDGREFVRRSRNVGIEELAQQIERPYELMFS